MQAAVSFRAQPIDQHAFVETGADRILFESLGLNGRQHDLPGFFFDHVVLLWLQCPPLV